MFSPGILVIAYMLGIEMWKTWNNTLGKGDGRGRDTDAYKITISFGQFFIIWKFYFHFTLF